MDDVLIERVEGRVAVLTLNRPDSLNALDTVLMRRLVEGVRRVADDKAIGCVVLTGAGRGFCSGGDVKSISDARDADSSEPGPRGNIESRTSWLRRNVEAARLLHEMPKPVIAMINGACAGAGLSLAAACDFRFAATSAKFRPAFTANGMPGDYGGSWLWPRILGDAKARQLYLIDEMRDACRALAFGLVDRVYPDSQLAAVTMALATRLAALPPDGLAYAKNNLNAATTETFAQSLDRESLNMMLARHALIEARKSETAT